MSLLVTGSIGIDTIETPAGKRDDVIGGSAVYFSLAASFFSPVRLVGVVGDDCPPQLLAVLRGRGIDTSGVEFRKGSRTFRWHGSYLKDLNQAETLRTDLNVLAEKPPEIPPAFRDSRFVFLANTHPALQQRMIDCLDKPRLIVADTMNLWISSEQEELRKLLRRVGGLVLNDNEARMLTGWKNLVRAGREILTMGPQFVVIKKGEHGCLMCRDGEIFALPAFPTDQVVDPTGAGDSFAGGMMGYLAAQNDVSPSILRQALAFGTVVASFTIADFSVGALEKLTRQEIDRRVEEFRQAVAF